MKGSCNSKAKQHSQRNVGIMDFEVYIEVRSETRWRCWQAGHSLVECVGVSILFCSRCGSMGTMSMKCSCLFRRRKEGRRCKWCSSETRPMVKEPRPSSSKDQKRPTEQVERLRSPTYEKKESLQRRRLISWSRSAYVTGVTAVKRPKPEQAFCQVSGSNFMSQILLK